MSEMMITYLFEVEMAQLKHSSMPQQFFWEVGMHIWEIVTPITLNGKKRLNKVCCLSKKYIF